LSSKSNIILKTEKKFLNYVLEMLDAGDGDGEGYDFYFKVEPQPELL
jgi:hypothetical protein